MKLLFSVTKLNDDYFSKWEVVNKKMAYRIQEDKCISCGACAAACPVGCISQGETCFVIDQSACISCGTCAGVCPVEAPVEE